MSALPIVYTDEEAWERVIRILRDTAEKILTQHNIAAAIRFEDNDACERALESKVLHIKSMRENVTLALNHLNDNLRKQIEDTITLFEKITEEEVAAAERMKRTHGKIKFLFDLLMVEGRTELNPRSLLDEFIEKLELENNQV